MSISSPLLGLVPRCLCCRVRLQRSETENQGHSSSLQNQTYDLREETAETSTLDFNWFINLLGISQSFSHQGFDFDISSHLEFHKKNSEFCSSCSIVLLGLETLQDLLEKTKVSIQERLKWIRKTVETAATSVQHGQEEDDPRFRFIHTEIIKSGQNDTTKDNAEEDSINQEHNDVDRDRENDVDIKLESPCLPDDDFEEIEFEFGGVDDINTPQELPDVEEPRTSRSEDKGQISTLNSKSNGEQNEQQVNMRGRPSRQKKKSVRLIGYEESLKIEKIGIANHTKRVHQLSQSDMQILRKFGLDKLPKLKIQLEDVCKPSFKKKQHVYVDPVNSITSDSSDRFANLNSIGDHQENDEVQSEFEYPSPEDEDSEFEIPTKRLKTSRRNIQSTKRMALKQQSHRRKYMRNTRNNNKPKSRQPKDATNDSSSNIGNIDVPCNSEDLRDPDFQPESDNESYSDSVTNSESNSEFNSENEESGRKPTANRKKRSTNGPVKTRRRRSSFNTSTIVTENGKRFYRKLEIVEEGDYLLCAFKPCDFKVLKNADDSKSCKEMLQHLTKSSVHAKYKKYGCNYCKLFFQNELELIRHRTEHHRREVMTECKICHKILATTSLPTHQLSHLGDEEHAAWVASGKNNPILKYQDKPYQCADCGMRFPQLRYLKSHELKHIEKAQRPKILHHIKKNQRPKRSHRREVMTECEICHKILTTEFFQKHQWSHLNDEEQASWVASGKQNPTLNDKKRMEKNRKEKRFQCAECGKRFSRGYLLKAHELTHIDISKRPKLICEKCGFVCTTSRGLCFHSMREHDTESSFAKWKICLICDQKFKVQTHLDIHKRIYHGAKKVHKCDKCPKSFSDSDGLKRHAVLHLPDPQPYKCQFCDSAYSYPNNLTRHIAKAHKDKNIVRSGATNPKNLKKPPSLPVMTCQLMFPCEICEKPFALRSRLKKHMQTSHGHKYVNDNDNSRNPNPVSDNEDQ